MSAYQYQPSHGGPPKTTSFMKQLQQQNDAYAAAGVAYQSQQPATYAPNQAQYQPATSYSHPMYQQSHPSSAGYYDQQSYQNQTSPYYSQQAPAQYQQTHSTSSYNYHQHAPGSYAPQYNQGWQQQGYQPSQPQYQQHPGYQQQPVQPQHQPYQSQPQYQTSPIYQASGDQRQHAPVYGQQHNYAASQVNQSTTYAEQPHQPQRQQSMPSAASYALPPMSHSVNTSSPQQNQQQGLQRHPTIPPSIPSQTLPHSGQFTGRGSPVQRSFPVKPPIRQQTMPDHSTIHTHAHNLPPAIPPSCTKPNVSPKRSDSVSSVNSVGSIHRPLPTPPLKSRESIVGDLTSTQSEGPQKRFKPRIGWGAPEPSHPAGPSTATGSREDTPPAAHAQVQPQRVQRVFDPPSSADIGGVKGDDDDDDVESIRKRVEKLIGPLENHDNHPQVTPKPHREQKHREIPPTQAIVVGEEETPLPQIQVGQVHSIPSIAFDNDEDQGASDPAVPTFSFDGPDEDEGLSSISISVAPPSPKPKPSTVDSHWTHTPQDPSEKNLPTYIPTIIPRSRGQPSEDENIVCAECGQIIVGRMVSALRGKKFHPDCFTCVFCGTNLEHIAFFEGPKDVNGSMKDVEEGKEIGGWCGVDWDEHFSLKCYHCKTAIVDESFITISEPSLGPPRTYHELHFFCANCGDPFIDPKSLLEKSRISNLPGVREENGRGERNVEAKPFVVRKGHPYCQSCNVKLYRPKCGGCGLGIEEETVVKALDKSWHERCFVCQDCKESFLTGSFFTMDDGKKKGGKKAYCENCYKVRLRDTL